MSLKTYCTVQACGKLEGVKRGKGRGGTWELSPESVEIRRKAMEQKKREP
jgi:hypothetical protein